MTESEKREKPTKTCDHTSVGMLIVNEGRLLLIERKKPPYGFAPPAGHVDDKGSFENAAREEVEEEVGLTATKITLLAEGRKENPCRRQDGDWHFWKVYRVETTGELRRSEDETKQAGWYTPETIIQLTQKTIAYRAGKITDFEWQKSPGIEPVWYDWFKELQLFGA